MQPLEKQTLEIRYVAPYLPWKVLIHFQTTKTVKIHTLKINNINDVLEFTSNYKMILRPLSDLTKEIEVNGKKFVPIVELATEENLPFYSSYFQEPQTNSNGDIFWVDYECADGGDTRFCYCIDSFQRGYLRDKKHFVVRNQLTLWQMMFEWHFDVFGLIDKNLAISIHDIKP